MLICTLALASLLTAADPGQYGQDGRDGRDGHDGAKLENLPWQQRAQAFRIIDSLKLEIERQKKDMILQASEMLDKKTDGIERRIQHQAEPLVTYVFIAAILGSCFGATLGVWLMTPPIK